MGRSATVLLLAFAAYFGTYVGFRQTRQEVWQKDGKTYVIFPPGSMGQTLYYAWRPLLRADGALTGMRFHIGPHL
jgi:hypothetical protein